MSIVVLGMHRSGTSLLVGLLGQFGHLLGDVSSAVSVLKPTGTKENIQLRKINNLLLNFNNSSWDNPTIKLKTNDEIEQEMSLFSRTLKNKWAIKDPRILLTYHIWEKYLPSHKVIATIRHPLLVAQSLKAKNNINEEQALQLWYVYNNRLLTLWKERPFPIINFDQSKNQYYFELKKLENYLNAEIEQSVFNEFYKHRESKDSNLSLKQYPEVNGVFTQLINASNQLQDHG